MVALCAGATDRFYIEDFTIAPGETRTEVAFADETCTVTTAAGHTWALGDVNHDTFIDINDVTLLIAQVLGTNPGICLICADLNDDHQIDINDVTLLINKVLGTR